ncbi:hypothetical protein D6D21_02160 [Aureobasidium pullulans]|uniref:FHA domain-containing protein n=1 Tax=Aureobasidium pullulans TaxID=5580 RepID=A0AB74JCS9_AURPU|nr:hypothetical protein D6D21_02160 [Aureobasidium pullulans]THX19173.1 hypothetical protein D6D12_10760 [Aureobasidium pullulans]THX24890.1 hypothetical protein D6D11_10424 [Aureobasidium pullulans]
MPHPMFVESLSHPGSSCHELQTTANTAAILGFSPRIFWSVKDGICTSRELDDDEPMPIWCEDPLALAARKARGALPVTIDALATIQQLLNRLDVEKKEEEEQEQEASRPIGLKRKASVDADPPAPRRQRAPPSTPPATTSSSRVFGRLTTTSDSFAAFAFDLKSNTTTFGCHRDCTVVLEDERLPKRAFYVDFTTSGLNSGGDWSLLPGLHCVIRAGSETGLLVNNKIQVHEGRTPQGIPILAGLKTGDVVAVCWARSIFKFRVELFVGAGSTY